ncbi:type II toxin-antitoxin system VapC family toxin [Sphingomonas sp. SUN039]|uniref:type II toxin-antitoxin system VapC family toxin n=1 Tax=Sphingomonas sp. SUN039 TaxID=2937787 RepID=UPI00216430E6|nr:type II toxin-antitoxin system VapC family toxin [Sphingomonas sp. SUN039]UVO54997.1 type II toxin-antitoxin system VapC family toxin [Sphingomonas sp. SUN039]
MLDTHIAVWAILGSPQLPRRALELLEDDDHTHWVSTVSLWEIAIKNGLKRAKTSRVGISASDANVEFERALFQPLAISVDAIQSIEDLPPHHGDPFDRLLIAQARTESMHLLTHDKTLAAYGDFVLVV